MKSTFGISGMSCMLVMSRPIRRVKNVTELPILAGPSRLGPRPKWNVTAPQPILSHDPRRCKKYPDPVNRSCLASRSFATHASHPPNVSTIPSISPENTFDIVIIGGGNAGLALTCALCELPLSNGCPVRAHLNREISIQTYDPLHESYPLARRWES